MLFTAVKSIFDIANFHSVIAEFNGIYTVHSC